MVVLVLVVVVLVVAGVASVLVVVVLVVAGVASVLVVVGHMEVVADRVTIIAMEAVAIGVGAVVVDM